MIVLAGIDEAGLGPTLGPLATGCAALLAPDGWRPDSPWEELSDACCREWRKGETRPGVADSKVLYRVGGVAALELTVGAFSFPVNGMSSPELDCSGLDGDSAAHPCYSRSLEPFPLHCDAADIASAARALEDALSKKGARAAHLAAKLLYEPVLNRRFDSGLNKNEALLMETGRHLTNLWEKFPDMPILAVVDKQGGRNNYLPFLTALFPGVWPQEMEAGAGRSVYRLRRDGGTMEIRFQAKADRDSFATALASLAAKYARERAMAELNAWFRERLPDVRDTAGYPEDAKRWLKEVRGAGADGLRIELLERKR